MSVCGSCSTDNPDAARFCMGCGAPLAAPAGPSEERKVITALFCDLVGFTAASDGADPEDVDRMLKVYFAVARSEIEGHGGVVEKFIGDAVVGVYGVPAAHEDDAERAIRAALRIVERASDLPALGGTSLRLRIGINTGEALVRLDVTPGAGERFLAGDTVNTASRIQSVAPEMGVAVGEGTYEATKARFDYEELEPATLKGKVEPVRVFHPRARRAEKPSATTSPGIRLAGRDRELQRLTDRFDASVATNVTQVVLISGAPGLGKSRLVAELLAHVESQAGQVTWRQGRCLPYGDGIAFWALGEIVKAHAGILETDSAADALEKLDAVLTDGPDGRWLRDRLGPLLGVESGPRADQGEQFAAWHRFLALIAGNGPTIVVFEDLHWADDSMLTWLDALAGAVPDAQLLVVGTTRPELADRRPDVLSGAGHATRIDLQPLNADSMSDLIGSLVGGVLLAPSLVAPILDRSGGNPLFIETFVRHLRDQDLLVAGADGELGLRPGVELPVPGSIQAVLAARIDALPPSQKQLLTDGAVVGRVFWSGVLLAMGERDASATEAELDGLVRRQLIEPVRETSMAGEAEYAFSHVLIRDAAYASLPRSARATRHVAAARWIESKLTDRLDDVADVLAYHYATALELARATGAADVPELERSACRFLVLAGERAAGFDAAAATSLLERALALSPAADPDRLPTLLVLGKVLIQAGRYTDALTRLEEALDTARLAGDRLRTAQALMEMSEPLRMQNRPGRSGEALAMLEPLGPTPQLVSAMLRVGSSDLIAGDYARALGWVPRLLEAVDAASYPTERERRIARSVVVGFRGDARLGLGDRGGFEDGEEAVRTATEEGDAVRTMNAYETLVAHLAAYDGPRAALGPNDEALAYASARGQRNGTAYCELYRVEFLHEAGDLDLALARGAAAEKRFVDEDLGPFQLEIRATLTAIATLRGQGPRPEALAWLEQTAREAAEPEGALCGFGYASEARLAAGDRDGAHGLLRELAAVDFGSAPWFYPRLLPTLVRMSIALDDLELAETFAGGPRRPNPLSVHAAANATGSIREARGDIAGAVEAYAAAAAGWATMQRPIDEAHARQDLGRCLDALLRADEAGVELSRAAMLFERLRGPRPVTGAPTSSIAESSQ